jgi:hypothetical protein
VHQLNHSRNGAGRCQFPVRFEDRGSRAALQAANRVGWLSATCLNFDHSTIYPKQDNQMYVRGCSRAATCCLRRSDTAHCECLPSRVHSVRRVVRRVAMGWVRVAVGWRPDVRRHHLVIRPIFKTAYRPLRNSHGRRFAPNVKHSEIGTVVTCRPIHRATFVGDEA